MAELTPKTLDVLTDKHKGKFLSSWFSDFLN
jgi:hypothetical protein